MDTTIITYIVVTAIGVLIPSALIVWGMMRHRSRTSRGIDWDKTVPDRPMRTPRFTYMCPFCGATSRQEQVCPSDVHDTPIQMVRLAPGDTAHAHEIQRIYGGHDDDN